MMSELYIASPLSLVESSGPHLHVWGVDVELQNCRDVPEFCL